VGFVWAGRYAEAERNLREALSYADFFIKVDTCGLFRDLGISFGLQGKYVESIKYFNEASENEQKLEKKVYQSLHSTTLSYWGIVEFRHKNLKQAKEYLNLSFQMREGYGGKFDFYEVLIALAHLAEVQHNWQEAADYYQQTLDLQTGRLYFESGAYTGLVRVHHATGNYAAIPDVLAEAETLAQQYEYNDHLASLRLSQGHIAWDGQIPAWGSGFDAALSFYQHALIYALRYNRFLLDEVLWGGNVTTPLKPIIPHCQQRGDEGQRMLAALRDWWQTGVNDSGTPRPDTISLVPEGVPLREAERIARANEPGDGSPQRDVVAVLGGVT
jgi:tetratricopeptide (TPR) repeat protein